MEAYIPLGIMALGTFFIVMRPIVARLYEKKRTKAMKRIAASMNFAFDEEGDDALLSSLSQLHLFSRGHFKYAWNVMHNRANDISLTIMDYKYSTGEKKSDSRKQTVILFQSSLLQLPSFALRPQRLFHKIAIALGDQDINFDSHPAFSKQYLLQGTEENVVRNIFSDDVLVYYEQHRKLSTDGDGDRLLFYRISKRVSPKNIRSFMEQGFVLFGLFKAESGTAS